MNRKLLRHQLEFEKARQYAEEQLDCGYPLSNELKNRLILENGNFFTLLPEDANLNQLYDFFGGLILPQNETINQFDKVTGKIVGSFTRVPTVDTEVAKLIYEELITRKGYACIFEDVQQELTSPHLEFFYQYGFSFSAQLCYFINKENSSLEGIQSGIAESYAIWHQLFFLTKIDFLNIPGQKIEIQTIQNFIQNIQLLCLGAYDGEGFIFWEPGKTPQYWS